MQKIIDFFDKIYEFFFGKNKDVEKDTGNKDTGNSEKKEKSENVSNEKSSEKFFGMNTLFDEIKKLNLEISPIRKYSSERYNDFKRRIDKLSEESKIFYEEKEHKKEFTLQITLGSNYGLELHKKLFDLLEEIKSYKREEYNYEYALGTLNEIENSLSVVYSKLIANNSKTQLLEKAYNHLNSKLEEIYNLDIEKRTFKQENMVKSLCKCMYIFLKCNARCDYICDVTEFEEIFVKEENTFWEIFLENVRDLLSKTQIFKDKKYTHKYQTYLQAILNRSDVDYKILLNRDFLKSFIEKEKKIIELHYYYSLEENPKNDATKKVENNSVKMSNASNAKICDEDSVKIFELKKYISNLLKLYSEDETTSIKLKLFENLICNFRYDITNYEVYKIVYFLGLKTVLSTYLRSAKEDDLMKKVFVSQKDVKIFPLKKKQCKVSSTIYKLFSCNVIDDIRPIIRIMNSLNIYYEVVPMEEDIYTIFYCAEYFEDCKNIQKNLNCIECY